MAYIDYDIDVSDFFDAMSISEKREMLDKLKNFYGFNNINSEEVNYPPTQSDGMGFKN